MDPAAIGLSHRFAFLIKPREVLVLARAQRGQDLQIRDAGPKPLVNDEGRRAGRAQNFVPTDVLLHSRKLEHDEDEEGHQEQDAHARPRRQVASEAPLWAPDGPDLGKMQSRNDGHRARSSACDGTQMTFRKDCRAAVSFRFEFPGVTGTTGYTSPSSSLASSDMRSWVQGGVQTNFTRTSLTPATVATA